MTSACLNGLHLKISPDVCLLQVPAIQLRRIVAYFNQFVVHTVRFVNRFAIVCEEVCASLFSMLFCLSAPAESHKRVTTSDILSSFLQKLANISLRIQQIETTLSILEAKVGSSSCLHV